MSATPLHGLALADARVAVCDARGQFIEEPGVALAPADEAPRFGRAARARARHAPRALCDRVWSALDARAPGGVRHAELAHAQLAALWRRVAAPDAPALVVVPASYHERGGLGVLLGVVQAAGVYVRALVETPLAACASPWPGVARAHLELDEHDCVLTLLKQEGGVRRRACRVLAEHGMKRARDALFAQAARALLASPARFDAFGSADSEQAVYDALFAEDAPARALRFSHAGRALEVEFEASAEQAALEKFTGAVCAFVARALSEDAGAGEAGIELGAHAACLPGLAEALEARCGARVRTLAPRADLDGLRARAAHIPARADVRLLTALPFATPRTEDAAHGA